MNLLLSCLYDFVFIFLLMLIVYSVFLNKDKKEYSKLKDNDMIKYFIARYDLDMRKTNYKTVLNTVTVINSFIISFCSVLVINIKGVIWAIIIGFAVIMDLTYSLYEIFGRVLKRREGK